jgi:hypothetical protein
MRRTPYSPFVLKAMAPLPWKVGRGVVVAGVGEVRRVILEYPSDFVGYRVYAAVRFGSIAVDRDRARSSACTGWVA